MALLDRLDRRFSVDVRDRPSTESEIAELMEVAQWDVPDDYLALIREASEVEICVDGIDYIRIWGATGAVEMNSAYDIQRRVPGIAIGDDEGGKALVVMTGDRGPGLYRVPFGAMAVDEAIYIAPSLEALLVHGDGIGSVFDRD